MAGQAVDAEDRDLNTYYEDGAVRSFYVGRTRPKLPDGRPDPDIWIHGQRGAWYRTNAAEEIRRYRARANAVPGTYDFCSATPAVIAFQTNAEPLGVRLAGLAPTLTPVQAVELARALQNKAEKALGGFADQQRDVERSAQQVADQFEGIRWQLAVQRNKTEAATVVVAFTDSAALSADEAVNFANDMHYAAAEAARLNKGLPEDTP